MITPATRFTAGESTAAIEFWTRSRRVAHALGAGQRLDAIVSMQQKLWADIGADAETR